MAMDWRAPYRWTIAVDDEIVPGPKDWPDVPWQYVFRNRLLAEKWAAHMVEYMKQTDIRAVPLPYVGVG